MKLRKAYKAVSSKFYWKLYYKGETPITIPTSGHHWHLFQKACIKLKRPEVIDEYSAELDRLLDTPTE